MSNKTKNKSGLPFSTFTLLIPIILALFSTLVVRLYAFRVPREFIKVSTSQRGMVGDVFLHGKSIVLYIAAAVALLFILCFKLSDRRVLYFKKFMIFGAIYLVGSGISAILAVNRSISFFGGEELFQGFWAIASYAVLFYYAYLLIMGEETRRRDLIKGFLRCVLVLSLIFCVIGLLQFTGNDPFSWSWIQTLCGLEDAQIVPDKNIYLTLYNSNYVGVMTVVLIPLLVIGIILDKVKVWRALFIVATIGILGCLIASGSKSGIATLVVLIVIALIIYGATAAKNKKVFISAGAIIAVVAVVVLCLNIGKINMDYSFASNRGYIWAKTAPMLPKKMLVGSGMSHFVLDFPNQDVEAKAKIDQASTIYNKPHNWYLQMATESGILAAIGMIIMIAIVLIETIKKMKKADDYNRFVLMGVGLSMLGFCGMGIFNDMMLMTAPLFFICVGMQAGVCYNNK